MFIDLVAPPFAGHLFPLLELGVFLKTQGFKIRVLSTSKAHEAIALSNLESHVLLPNKDKSIASIADPPYQVRNNPFFLLRQFESNLALMKDLKLDLKTLWQQDKPDLVLADFTLPLAGILAKSLGIHWWTSLPTPCALESKTGTPSYLGGWMPGSTPFHTMRDAIGRVLVKKFKQFIDWRYHQPLFELGIDSLYHPDGTEIVYSPQCILALGIPDFEFVQDWPSALRFVGPLTASPPFKHTAPEFQENKKHVLVSLGTHIPWAKEHAAQFCRILAQMLPEINFHFTYGRTGQNNIKVEGNLALHDYIPYDLYLKNYDLAIIHGGTGINYSCLKAGIPMLVWPHDYDQFDHAARIVYHGLGLKTNGQLQPTLTYLKRLLNEDPFKQQALLFQKKLQSYDAKALVLQKLESLI
jgi:UDP:flavonoid glycosyltransferase YjiC (YdhE family)